MNILKKCQKGWLVITLQDEGWQWISQLPGKGVHRGNAPADMPPAEKVDTILLVPGERVTVAKVTLGRANAQTLRWQMEPLLTEDIERLHIVRLESQGDEHLMAAIDRDEFSQMLQALTDHGYIPQRVLPDTLAIEAGRRLRFGDQWILRLADGSALKLPESGLTSFPQLITLAQQQGDSLLMLANVARSSRYNLLQDDFAARPSLQTPLLVFGAMLMLCWYSILFTPLWEGWQSQREITQLNQRVLERYQRYFPLETPSFPLRALSRKAVQVDDVPYRKGLLSLLSHASPLLGKLQENPLQTLVWDGSMQQLILTFRDTLPTLTHEDELERVTFEIKEKQLLMRGKP